MEKRKCLCVILWKAKAGDSKQKVLLLKMRAERGGHWQPVTGHVENGEDFAGAALREAEEESGFHFDRKPQYLGMEYRFQGRFGAVIERAYAIWIYGNTPPTPKLDPNEHIAYQWVSPEEAEQLLFYPSNKEALRRASSRVPPLFLSKQGLWFQEGEEISHERTVELLHKSLLQMKTNYIVRISDEEAEVIVEDVPRFITSYDAKSGTIRMKGDLSVTLNPDQVWVGGENILYCQLPDGLAAKFLSSAYYEIAKDIEISASGEHLLHFLGGRHRIRIPH